MEGNTRMINTSEIHTKNIKTALNIHKTPQKAYNEYKDLFINSTLPIRDIYAKIGVPQTQNTHYYYIQECAKKEGLNPNKRRLKLKKGGRPKGSKNLPENDDQYEDCYKEFLKYYDDLSLAVQDILKIMGTHHKSKMYMYFRKRMKEDGLDINERQRKVISKKLKKTYETRRKDNEQIYEEEYQQYKKLFKETNLTIKEIYNQLNIGPRTPCAIYIRKRAKEESLNSYMRNYNIFGGTHTISDEEKKIREDLYKEYKRLFFETDMTIADIHKNLKINTASSRAKYLRDKAISEGLDGRVRMNKIRRKHKCLSSEKGEPLYEEYKRLYKSTEYKIYEIYEKLHVKKGSAEYEYIRRRCKEESLDGRARKTNLQKKTLLKFNHVNTYKKLNRNPQFSDKTIKQVKNSKDTLNKLFDQRNIKPATKKGYFACLYHWFKFQGDTYNNIQENIDLYLTEEDERIPIRKRTIKKDLLNFREYLINCKTMNTKRSIMSYYSKITAIFRHFELEIPDLPKVKMEEGYVSNYNDLPTHDMIRTACDQSSDLLKSIFVFMSSSGTAKAETLSITVNMFMEGCSEYLNEYPTSKNLEKCIKKLKGRHDIIPLIYLRRLKTDKWYYTCCSPEASYLIIEYLNNCNNLKWDDKLFPLTSSLLLTKFQEINDYNEWGRVGGYRKFRSHALRKFMASNIGLPRDQVDSLQGRAKDTIAEAYFKQDPRQLKEVYMEAMHRVMIYDNWGYETSVNPKNDRETIIKDNNQEELQNTDIKHNFANELLKYTELLEKGAITQAEFNILKQKLWGELI